MKNSTKSRHRLDVGHVIDLSEGYVDLNLMHDEMEKQVIEGTLEFYAGHKSNTAAALGRSRRWLWLRIKELGIDEPDMEEVPR